MKQSPETPAADGLRKQYAEAIRNAACTGGCGLTELQCTRQRIQPEAWHRGVLAEVSGTPEMLAVAVLAARDREMEQLRAQVEAARRFAAEMRDFCSPHGVSVHYADQLTAAMDRAKEGP
jgi:hypothetical protein